MKNSQGRRLKWSADDLEALRSCYPAEDTETLAQRLSREPSALRKMANALGVRKEAGYSSRIRKLRGPSPASIATRFKPKHGRSAIKAGAYRAWLGMKARCNYAGHKSFADYGGRGIQVCERWQSFEAFLEDMGEPTDGLTLGRKDNEGDYTPANCRWETKSEQARNRRSSRFIEAFGRRMVFADAADEFGIRGDTLSWRLKRGMSPEQALSLPVGSRP